MIAPQRPIDDLSEETREARAAARPAADFKANADPASGPHPFEPLLKNLEEMTGLASLYVQSRVEMVAVKARRIALWGVIGLAALVAAIALVVAAIVMSLRGLAGGLQALGLMAWGADLLIGVLVLLILASAAAIGLGRWKTKTREKTVAEYDRRKAEFHARFGHDAAQSGCDRQ